MSPPTFDDSQLPVSEKKKTVTCCSSSQWGIGGHVTKRQSGLVVMRSGKTPLWLEELVSPAAHWARSSPQGGGGGKYSVVMEKASRWGGTLPSWLAPHKKKWTGELFPVWFSGTDYLKGTIEFWCWYVSNRPSCRSHRLKKETSLSAKTRF